MERDFSLSRRSFLRASAGALAVPVLMSACGRVETPTPPRPQLRGHLYGFGRDATQKHFFVGTVNLDRLNQSMEPISDITFFGHGLAINPARPNLAVVTEKHGPGACEVDLSARRVTRALKAHEGCQFYGHGAFSPDGRQLYLVESLLEDGSYDGVITVRDGATFEIQTTLPSHGRAPHDCLMIDNGATLVVTNGGGPAGSGDSPCVTYVDLKTHKLKHRLALAAPGLNAGHLAMTSRGDLVLVSAPREGTDTSSPEAVGGISFYSPGGALQTADASICRRMRMETLSVAIHEPSMVVAATNPDADLVTFWDFRTRKLLKAMDGDFRRPRGVSVTLDGRCFALTFDEATHSILIDAATLEPIPGTQVDLTYISGSHNYIYSPPA